MLFATDTLGARPEGNITVVSVENTWVPLATTEEGAMATLPWFPRGKVAIDLLILLIHIDQSIGCTVNHSCGLHVVATTCMGSVRINYFAPTGNRHVHGRVCGHNGVTVRTNGGEFGAVTTLWVAVLVQPVQIRRSGFESGALSPETKVGIPSRIVVWCTEGDDVFHIDRRRKARLVVGGSIHVERAINLPIE